MKERISINSLPIVKKENLKHLVRYVNFINSRPERKLKQKGFETHHVYPRSIAKKNNIEDYDGNWNLIELTPREHFIAHMILFYCGYKEMIYCFITMSKENKNYKFITSRLYLKIQIANSNLQRDRVWIKNIKTNESKHIQSDEIEYYLCQGFEFGRILSEETRKNQKEAGIKRKGYKPFLNLKTNEIKLFKKFIVGLYPSKIKNVKKIPDNINKICGIIALINLMLVHLLNQYTITNFSSTITRLIYN